MSEVFISVKVKRELKEAVEAAARAEERSVSAVIRMALTQHLRARKSKPTNIGG